jgi:hypothetical protein
MEKETGGKDAAGSGKLVDGVMEPTSSGWEVGTAGAAQSWRASSPSYLSYMHRCCHPKLDLFLSRVQTPGQRYLRRDRRSSSTPCLSDDQFQVQIPCRAPGSFYSSYMATSVTRRAREMITIAGELMIALITTAACVDYDSYR